MNAQQISSTLASNYTEKLEQKQSDIPVKHLCVGQEINQKQFYKIQCNSTKTHVVILLQSINVRTCKLLSSITTKDTSDSKGPMVNVSQSRVGRHHRLLVQLECSAHVFST